MQSVYDALDDLQYYGGHDWLLAYNYPIGLRNYYIKRLGDRLEKQRQQIEKSKSSK